MPDRGVGIDTWIGQENDNARAQHAYRQLAVPERLVQTGLRGGEEVRTRLLPPLHGDSSGVRGAAWLWPKTMAED